MNSKILKISAFLLGLSFPVHTGLSNIFAGIFCVSCVYFLWTERKEIRCQSNALIFSTLLLVLLFITGIFTADQPSTAFNHFMRRISYLVFPLLLVAQNKKWLDLIFRAAVIGLIVGCLFSGIYLLSRMLIFYFGVEGHRWPGFNLLDYYHTYHHFTRGLGFHPTYLGSYFFLSVVMLLKFLHKTAKKKLRSLALLLLLFFLLICLFINSRIVLVLVSLSVAIYFFLIMKKIFVSERKRFWTLLISVIAGLTILGVLIKDTYIYYRFTDELKFESELRVSTRINEQSGGDSRLARWESILKVIGEKPILGHGTGNEKKVLEKQFKTDGLVFSADELYDSHNLYLSYGVQFGLLGIIVLIFYYMGNVFVSIRASNLPYFLFMTALICISLFENYLNNNAGVVFVAFFQNLFLFKSLKEKL